MKIICICFFLLTLSISKAQLSDTTQFSTNQKNAPLIFKFDKFSLLNQSTSQENKIIEPPTNFTRDPYLCFYMPHALSPMGGAQGNKPVDVAAALANGTLNTIYHYADKKLKEKAKTKR